MPPKGRPDKDKSCKEDRGTAGEAAVGEIDDAGLSRCGSCMKAVTDHDDGVCCEICGIWFHCRCQGIAEQMYKAMTLFKDDLHW